MVAAQTTVYIFSLLILII